MNSLNEAFESLDRIYEGYDINTYAGLGTDEVKAAQEEFKKLNDEGTLDYDVFHKAYDAALKQNAAGFIDQIFDDEGKLKGRYVYGAIKEVYPQSLSNALKQLWSLAFVENVLASRQAYADKKKAERDAYKERQKQIAAGNKAYKLDTQKEYTKYKEFKKQIHDEELLQAQTIADRADKVFSEEFKKRYLELCHADNLVDCIEVDLEYTPSIKIKTLKEGATYNKPDWKIINYTLQDVKPEAKRPIKQTEKEVSDTGIKYCGEYGRDETVTVYSYDPAVLKDVFNMTEVDELLKSFEDENKKVIEAAAEFDNYKLDYTIEDFCKDLPNGDALAKFVQNHKTTFTLYLGMSDKKLFTPVIQGGVGNVAILSKESVKYLSTVTAEKIYAMEYDFKGGSGHYGNNPNGSYWADENWRVAINDDCPVGIRKKLEVDEKPLFGSTGGTEVKPKSDEAELGFDHYFEMEYVIDTSG